MQPQQPPEKPAAKTNTRRWGPLVIALLIAAFIALAVSLLPRGYSQDFSIIGKGSNVVVLVHDHNVVQSMDTMSAMNEVRDEYEGRVKFLVADRYVAEGARFAQAHGVSSIGLIFFAPDGSVIHILDTAQDAESLRKNINKAYNL
jgi:UDP-N-acetylenolpyruvoylglucosamine reductase